MALPDRPPLPDHPGEERLVLSMAGVSKAYGATIAVRTVSIDIEAGRIHALLGENGAGKSTIVKILSGIVAPDAGTLTLDGKPYAPANPMAARAAGVSTAFQELSLLPNLTVAQNLMLPHQATGAAGLIARKANRDRAASLLTEFGLGHIDPDVLAGALSLAEKQRIEIMRALSRRPRLLVLDEPTAALADPEWLFNLLEQFTVSGASVLYISHRLSEIRRLCRRGTVLRNGESVRTVSLENVTDADIFEMMVGFASSGHQPRPAAARVAMKPALEVSGISGGSARDISLTLGEGEIVGVAGLEGQGQRDLFRILAGVVPASHGEIKVNGTPVTLAKPADAAKLGIGFVPEERKTEGVFLGLRTDYNMSLPVLGLLSRFGVVRSHEERAWVRETAARVDLAERYLPLRIGELSGGNQQKALIGRVVGSGAKILLLFDPTRGVDVGTKSVIYEVIRNFAKDGGAALIYSTELSELVHLVDRCLVIYRGRLAGEASGELLSEPHLVALAAGQGARA